MFRDRRGLFVRTASIQSLHLDFQVWLSAMLSLDFVEFLLQLKRETKKKESG